MIDGGQIPAPPPDAPKPPPGGDADSEEHGHE